MNFSFDIAEDVAAQVEEMSRLSMLGFFRRAREISASSLANHTDIFPVAAERMRLLYDQGDFEELFQSSETYQRDYIRSLVHYDVAGDVRSQIVWLFGHIAALAMGKVQRGTLHITLVNISEIVETFMLEAEGEAQPEQVSAYRKTV